MLDDSLGEAWGDAASAASSAAASASSAVSKVSNARSAAMGMVESKLRGLSLVWKKMLSRALKKLFAGDLAGAKQALLDGSVQVLKPMTMNIILEISHQTQEDLATMVNRAEMYITPFFSGRWTIDYENSFTRLTRNEPNPIDGSCARNLAASTNAACRGNSPQEKKCYVDKTMFEAWSKLNASQKQKYPVVREVLHGVTAATFKRPCDAKNHTSGDSLYSSSVSPRGYLLGYAEWCKRTSDAGSH